MTRFARILATTDLSPESYSAVIYAARLAEAEGSRLSVLHVPHSPSLVYSDFALPIDMGEIDEQIEAAAREELEAWTKRHLRHVAGVEVVLRRGIVHETICRVAGKLGANVIVMATHGRKGLGHLVLGSVTERVLRDAPCPVLVVKPPRPVKRASRKANEPDRR